MKCALSFLIPWTLCATVSNAAITDYGYAWYDNQGTRPLVYNLNPGEDWSAIASNQDRLLGPIQNSRFWLASRHRFNSVTPTGVSWSGSYFVSPYSRSYDGYSVVWTVYKEENYFFDFVSASLSYYRMQFFGDCRVIGDGQRTCDVAPPHDGVTEGGSRWDGFWVSFGQAPQMPWKSQPYPEPSPVPVPASLSLLTLALAALGVASRKVKLSLRKRSRRSAAV